MRFIPYPWGVSKEPEKLTAKVAKIYAKFVKGLNIRL